MCPPSPAITGQLRVLVSSIWTPVQTLGNDSLQFYILKERNCSTIPKFSLLMVGWLVYFILPLHMTFWIQGLTQGLSQQSLSCPTVHLFLHSLKRGYIGDLCFQIKALSQQYNIDQKRSTILVNFQCLSYKIISSELHNTAHHQCQGLGRLGTSSVAGLRCTWQGGQRASGGLALLLPSLPCHSKDQLISCLFRFLA